MVLIHSPNSPSDSSQSRSSDAMSFSDVLPDWVAHADCSSPVVSIQLSTASSTGCAGPSASASGLSSSAPCSLCGLAWSSIVLRPSAGSSSLQSSSPDGWVLDVPVDSAIMDGVSKHVTNTCPSCVVPSLFRMVISGTACMAMLPVLVKSG